MSLAADPLFDEKTLFFLNKTYQQTDLMFSNYMASITVYTQTPSISVDFDIHAIPQKPFQ